MPANLGNARLHWRTKQQAKVSYFAWLDGLQATGKLPPPPRTPMARPTIRVVMTLWNRMDADNAMARLKWPCDWLQSRGYIANDKDLEWHGLPTQIISRRLESSLQITLLESSPAPSREYPPKRTP